MWHTIETVFLIIVVLLFVFAPLYLTLQLCFLQLHICIFVYNFLSSSCDYNSPFYISKCAFNSHNVTFSTN